MTGLIKAPCDDCRVREVINCQEIPIGLDEGIRLEITRRLGELMVSPESEGVTPVDKAFRYCDHWHRWGAVVGLPEADIASLTALKAKRKNILSTPD